MNSMLHPRPQSGAADRLFVMTADADPNLFPRVLDLWAKLGLVPRSAEADLIEEAGQEPYLAMKVRVGACSPSHAETTQRRLEGLYGMRQVVALDVASTVLSRG